MSKTDGLTEAINRARRKGYAAGQKSRDDQISDLTLRLDSANSAITRMSDGLVGTPMNLDNDPIRDFDKVPAGQREDHHCQFCHCRIDAGHVCLCPDAKAESSGRSAREARPFGHPQSGPEYAKIGRIVEQIQELNAAIEQSKSQVKSWLLEIDDLLGEK